MEAEVGLGYEVTLNKGSTFVTGRINGVKLNHGDIERISLEEIDNWFFMSDGWLFVVDGEDDEIQPE
jgi:hypothetical protein